MSAQVTDSKLFLKLFIAEIPPVIAVLMVQNYVRAEKGPSWVPFSLEGRLSVLVAGRQVYMMKAACIKTDINGKRPGRFMELGGREVY